MKPFLLQPDASNQPTSTPPAPDYVQAVVLTGGAPQTITVPALAEAGFVIFSSEGPFWAKSGGTAAVPSVTTSDGSASALNPSSWTLGGVSTISLIAESDTKLSLSFYKCRP